MAYSAVTQPSPEPLRQRGTPSAAEAAHSTRVRPNSTSTDPAAWSSQCRVILIGRSSSSARPSARVMTADPRGEATSGLAAPVRLGERRQMPRGQQSSQRDTEFVEFVTAQRTRAGADGPPAHRGRRRGGRGPRADDADPPLRHWPRVRRAGNPVGYARTSLTHAFVDEQRRAYTPARDAHRRGLATRPTHDDDQDLAHTVLAALATPGPAPARGRRAPPLPRPRHRRDRPGPRLHDRHRQVPERQGARAPPQPPSNPPHVTLARSTHERPQHPPRPRRRPGHRSRRRPRRPDPRPPRPLPHPPPSRRGRPGSASPPSAWWASASPGSPSPTAMSRPTRPRPSTRRAPVSPSSPSRSRPAPTPSTRPPRAGRSRAPTRTRSPSRRSASPTRSRCPSSASW